MPQAWLSIDSPLWSLRYYGGPYVLITQRATRATRQHRRLNLPSNEAFALMPESRFNAVCREAFHA